MFSINRIVKAMIISDFFFNCAWGLLSPIFALFIAQRITNDVSMAATVAGFAALIYWSLKSIIQIPIGRYLDKNHGEKDDFWFMVIGHVITGIVPFIYIISYQSWHIYALQVLQAIGMAMLIPSWYAVLSRHIDKGKEAFEWGLSSTVLGFATGITGAIGGIIAASFNFNIIFVFAGTVNMISALLLFYIYDDLSKGENIKHQTPPFLPF